MREEKLQQIVEMIPLMSNMVDEDLAISVWDREGTVLYFQKADNFPLHFDVGYRHEDKNDKLFQAMNTGKTIHNVLPKEVFGIPIEGNLVPVFDNGEVVGCIACVYSVEKIEELEYQANEVKNILEQSKDSIYGILNTVVDTTKDLEEVNQDMDKLEKSINAVYDVVDSIKANTARTKMLSLNASIEAARAGEYGKGFTIVANEMGKLSQMSAESVTDINDTLNKMTSAVSDIIKAINKINEVSSNNSQRVEKILEGLNKTIK